jgi:ribose 5-phosphate isomerase RpiB
VADLAPNADSVDYPDYGYKLASAMAAGEAERGIALCGSGIGISIAVNRNPACAARWWANRFRPSSRASTTMPTPSPWAPA